MTEKFASSKYGDFIIQEELYRSQAGAVYKVMFKYDQKQYVLKERKLPKSKNWKIVMNEVKLLQQLHHSNVIKCEGWFRDEHRQSIFIVLEFCGGGDMNTLILKQRATKEYFKEEQMWNIFHQLCLGLRHLHENGIIHRDLKPLNIMISTSGRTFKLGDLGVSRQLSEETLLVRSFYGTPLYLSPELVDNKPYNEKTDIWSLGVILYEICALQPPFQGNTLLDVAKLVSGGKYPPLPRQFSAHVHRCVAWMLQLDYSKRPNIVQLLQFVESRLSRDVPIVGLLPSAPVVEQLAVPAAATGSDGCDSADDDTASEGSGLEQDSLEEGAHRGEGGCHNSNSNLRSSHSGRDTKLCQRHAPTAVGSDADTASEGGGDKQNHCGGFGSEEGERKSAQRRRDKVTEEDFQPRTESAAPNQARRQSIQQLRLEKLDSHPTEKKSRGRDLSTVQVDVQRVQVLLRREAATLRKLLQLRDFVANSPAEAAAAEAEGVRGRIGATQQRLKLLERALDQAGLMDKEDAHMFGMDGEVSRAVARSSSAKAAMPNGGGKLPEPPGAAAVPVTRLPHRPGEEDVLGLDINADRRGHSRHLVDPAYFAPADIHPIGAPRTAEESAGHRRHRQHRGSSSQASNSKPPSSPERKQVSGHDMGKELDYSPLGVAADRSRPADFASKINHKQQHREVSGAGAAGLDIGKGALSQQALFQKAPAAAKPGLFSADFVSPAQEGNNNSERGKDGAVSQPAREEYRIFDARHDRCRPGTAVPARSVAGRTFLVDRNEQRKEELLARWDRQGTDKQQRSQDAAGGEGGLALPSMLSRPKSAHPTVGRQQPRPMEAQSRQRGSEKVEEKAQYVDIMQSACRAIADKHRRPAHRRLKSDVTNPGYVLPQQPPFPSTAAADQPQGLSGEEFVGAQPIGTKGQQRKVSIIDVRAVGQGWQEEEGRGSEMCNLQHSPERLAKGRSSRAEFDRERRRSAGAGDIKLRGTGHHADGELLPAEARRCRDSAYRLLIGT